MSFQIDVKGRKHRADVDGDTPLLWVLRDVLGLMGAEASTPMLSAVTQVATAGLVFNGIQAVRDKQASFSGSVT